MKTKIVSNNLLLAVAATLIIGGCASTTEIEKAQTMAQQALDAANRAASKAEQADSKADRAMQAARQAQSLYEENSEKINRLLESSMSK